MIRPTLAGIAATAALLAGAGSALADSAALSVTTSSGQPDSVAYIPRVFTIAGNAPAGTRLYVKHRAAGGAGCAPSAYTDSGTFLDSSFYGVPVSGAFSLQRVLTWRAPGTWMLCFWFASDETAIAPPIQQVIAVRSPAGTIGATVSPNPARAGDRALITVAGSSEAPRRVYAKIRSTGGPSCAPTFDADPGGSMISGWSVDGAFAIKANVNDPVAGEYLICMWLAGASDDALPVAGPQSQVFSVVRASSVVVSSAVVLNCRTRTPLRRVRAARVRSVCMRYKFSSPPLAGRRMTLSYVAPSRRTYKTVRATSRGARTQTLSAGALPARAYKRRRGTWRAVLRIDGRQVASTSFRVT